MTLASVSPAPGPERVREYSRRPWNACQRLFRADGWMHNNLRTLVGGTPEKLVYRRVVTRSDGSARGQPDGPAWLHVAAARGVPAVTIPRGVPRDPYLAGKAAA
jgi:hypothetical protein